VQEQEVKGIYFTGEQGRLVAEELEANGIYFTGEQGLAGVGGEGDLRESKFIKCPGEGDEPPLGLLRVQMKRLWTPYISISQEGR